jgi:hypothetical protein
MPYFTAGAIVVAGARTAPPRAAAPPEVVTITQSPVQALVSAKSQMMLVGPLNTLHAPLPLLQVQLKSPLEPAPLIRAVVPWIVTFAPGGTATELAGLRAVCAIPSLAESANNNTNRVTHVPPPASNLRIGVPPVLRC